MIDRRNLGNPLRWYLAAVLLGMVLNLLVGDQVLKFHYSRLVQLLPALGLLAWCFRPQPPAFFREPVISGWYGLGLVGFALTALVGGFLGPIPWISLAFLGLALLQFGLLPLLRPAWQRHGPDTLRVLALFALAVLGIDVGIWLAVTIQGQTPYAYTYWLTPQSSLDHVPYLHLNVRWANQLPVLLIWSFVPLLQQLQQGEIRRLRWFWWPVCAAIPLLGMAQILFSNGDGAFLAAAAATALMALLGWRGDGAQRRLWWSATVAMLAAVLVAGFGDWLLDGSRFFVGGLVERNVSELSEGLEREGMRLGVWRQHLRAALGSPLWGGGIQALPPERTLCTPHNLWVGLLHWTGLLGTGCALLLAGAFVPRRWSQLARLSRAAPLLAALFVYQLVDDIWLRPFALAVLLVVLPGLLAGVPEPPPQTSQPLQPGWLKRLAFPAVTYRFLTLLGVLLVVVSFVLPEGVQIGPSPLVQQRGAECLLFF
ncbi:hypothetical protein [Cyanobium sp. CH-040]|uniref:hypothetical protein n=1 Tax=Cyanobium sp. CH-040 TaxID=2823708 RepID=UPI0020CEC605|nr:hypothetical protein [Cyanobium sp. CH-040]MCP9926323.1 hypothetical protein [Cyanobium sp. CH-040]